MKRILTILAAGMLLLCGCSVKPQITLSEGEHWLSAECEAVETAAVVSASPEPVIADTLFTEHAQWQGAAEGSSREVLRERAARYDAEFFEENVLCIAVKTTSGGMRYRFEGASLAVSEGKSIVNVYGSYSDESVHNCMADYYFFVEIPKSELSHADEVVFNSYGRDIFG